MRAQSHLPDQKPGRGASAEARQPGSGSIYTLTWAALASVSVGYMAVLLLQPEWAAPITTQSIPQRETPPASSHLVEQLSGEVDSLRKTIADLQRELSEVKSTAASKLEPEPKAGIDQPSYGAPIILNRQTAEVGPGIVVETPELRPSQADIRLGETRESGVRVVDRDDPVTPEPMQVATASPKPVKTEDVVRTKTGKPDAEMSPVVRTIHEEPRPALAPSPPAPVKKVVVLNAKPTARSDEGVSGSQLETGSLRPSGPPEITFGPATVTPAAQAVAIHLDAAPSLEALRLRWDVLLDRHRSALNGLEPRYLVSGTADSPSYLLMAGPILSPDEASRICALLRARRVACSVGGPFAGQAL